MIIYPSAMVVGNIPDVLASRVPTWIMPCVRHEVSFSDLILLLVLHHMFYHRIVATGITEISFEFFVIPTGN